MKEKEKEITDTKAADVELNYVRVGKVKYWLSSNPGILVLFITVIGTIIFTAFIDFTSDKFGISITSHLKAINELRDNSSGFFLFAIYLLAIIQLANAFSFKKTRSPKSFVLFNIVSLVQVGLVARYISFFIIENATRNNYSLSGYTYMSMAIMAAGAIFFIFASILTIKYVDWKYEKIED